jgi:hypothetical protein
MTMTLLSCLKIKTGQSRGLGKGTALLDATGGYQAPPKGGR